MVLDLLLKALQEEVRTGKHRRGARHQRWADAVALLVLVTPVLLTLVRSRELGLSCAALRGPLDVRLVGYLLEWGFLKVSGAIPTGALWSPPFFFPEPNVLAYSENFIAGYAVYFPFRFAGIGPAASVFLMHCVLRALTPIGTYLCFRALRLSRWSSFVGAGAYSWGWVSFHHLGHIQFSAGFLVPVFFTASYLGLKHARPWLWVVAFWTFVLSVYFSVYTAVFLSLGAVTLGVVALLLPGGGNEFTRLVGNARAAGKRSPRQMYMAALASAAAVAALIPAAQRYLEAQTSIGSADPTQLQPYWGTLFSWIQPSARNLLFGEFRDWFPPPGVAPYEKAAFFGWFGLAALLAPAFFLMVKRKRVFQLWPRLYVTASIGGILIVLVFSSYGGSLWELPFWILRDFFPGLKAIRAPTRIAIVVSWLAALCAAKGLDLLRRNGRGSAALTMVVGGLLLAENWTPPIPIVDRCQDEAVWDETRRTLCPQVPKDKVETLLFLPIPRHPVIRAAQHSMAMHLALSCDLNVVNGYSGRFPPKLEPLLRPSGRGFPCETAQKTIGRIHEATGKGVLVHFDHGSPMGPGTYDVGDVAQCLRPWLADEAPPMHALPARPSTVFLTDPGKSDPAATD